MGHAGAQHARVRAWAVLLAVLGMALAASAETAMAAYPVVTTGFEHGAISTSGNLFSTVQGDGLESITSTTVRSGNYALRVGPAPSGTSAGAYLPVPSSSTMTVRFAVNFSAVPSSGNPCVFAIRMSSNWAGRVALESSGRLRFNNGSGSYSYGPYITPGQWYVIDLWINASSSTWTGGWRVNGTSYADISWASGYSGARYAQDLFFGHTGAYSQANSYDDVSATTSLSDYPLEDGRVYPLRPASSGTHSSSGNYRNNGGSAIDSSSAGRIDDNPLTSTADWVQQSAAGSGSYLEFGFDAPTSPARAVSAVLAQHASGTSSTTATTRIMHAGGTANTLYSGNMSTGSTLTYRQAMIPAPSGGWTVPELAGMNARLGYASSIASIPYWDALVLEAEYPLNSPPNSTASLAQYHSNGTTSIPSGGWTKDGVSTNVVLKFQVSDPDAMQTLTPWVEVRPGITAFSATCGTAVGGVTFSGSPINISTAGGTAIATVNVTGLTSGQTYRWRACSVDQTGAVSSWTASGSSPDFRIDATAPPVPSSANDGTGSDVDYSTSTTQLSANWTSASDPLSGLARYEYCISTSSTCSSGVVVGWTTNGTSTTLTRTGLSLTNGTTYYVCVRTFDNAGNQSSSIRCTDGQMVDAAAPAAVSTVRDGTGTDITWTGSTSQLSANWTSSSDSHSGLNRYEYCMASTSGCGSGVVQAWTTNGTSTTVTRTGLSLTHGSTYFTCVRAVDNAGNVSSVTCSNGQAVDSVATAASSVRDGTGTDIDLSNDAGQLSANWPAVTDSGSGLDRYEYCMASTSGCGSGVVQGWTTNGTATSVTRTGLSLVEGTTYYTCVRVVDNVGNVSSVTCSDGQTIDTSVSAPANVRDGSGSDIDWTNSSTQLTANWPAVADASGINRYEYCMASTSGCGSGVVQAWTTNGASTSVTRTGLSLSGGTTYFTCVRAVDNAGNTSAAACSDGQAVDITPPGIPASVADGTGADVDFVASSTTVSANWPAASDDQSGLERYEYCISTAAGCSGTVAASWTSTSTSTFVTRSGLSLTDGTTYYVCVRTVDVAGNQSTSSRCSDGQAVDVSVPAPASVADGTGADIDFTGSDSELAANWAAVTDGGSGLQRYEYCMATSPTCASGIVQTWTSNATSTSVTRTALTLADATGYYTCVRAVDSVGNVSAATCSDGQTVDVTAPAVPAWVYDGTASDRRWTNATNQLSANWAAVTDTSGVQRYEYCMSTVAGCSGTVVRGWTSNGTSTTVTDTGGTLEPGETYYTCVRVFDNVGLQSGSYACSNGIEVDVDRPTRPELVSPVSGSGIEPGSITLVARFLDSTPQSLGRLQFQLCSTANCSSVVSSGWSSSGLAQGATASWSPAAPPVGTYYWRARGRDAALNYSAWTPTWMLHVSNPPQAPTPVSPTDTAWVTTLEPQLTATFLEADAGETGRLTFELCEADASDPWASNCASGYESGGSAGGLASSSNGSWQPVEELDEGTTYYWRARGRDQYGLEGPWSGAWQFRIDVTPPPAPTGVGLRSRGQGAISVGWTGVADAPGGSGNVVYHVEHSPDGTTWNSACDATTSTSCQIGGLGSSNQVFIRIKACDEAGNCSMYAHLNETTGSEYFLRYTTMSGVLSDGANRQATLPPLGAANSSTSVKHGSTDGWYLFHPGVTDSTVSVASEPADQPWSATGTGWVVDDYAGKQADGGPIQLYATVTSSNTNGTAVLQCRAWKVTTDGAGAISPFPAGALFLGKQTLGDDVTLGNGSTSMHACDMDGLAGPTTFGPNEALYVELWLNLTGGSGGPNQVVSLSTEGADSYITAPEAGTPPDVPVMVSPAEGTLTGTAPTLTATYTHPAVTDGVTQFQVATDAAFTNVVDAGSSPTITSGSNGSYDVQGLQAGVAYYWRVRGQDSFNRVSAWSGSRTLMVSQPPARPVNASPAHLAAVSGGVSLSASAFSDEDAGDAHAASHWQVRRTDGSYLDAAADSGITATDLTSWTVPALPTGVSYAWRVRYQDATGAWSAWSSETIFTPATAPGAPTSLLQYSDDGTVIIASGDTTTDGVTSDLLLVFTLSDPDSDQTLTPWVELRPLATPFSGTCGTAGTGMHTAPDVTTVEAGSSHTVQVRVTGLTPGQSYHWRACAVDQYGLESPWTTHGGSPDFVIDGTLPMSVDSASPASAPQGRRDLTVEITGSGFESGAAVAFSGAGISVDATTVVSDTRIDVVIDVTAGASVGLRDITVTNPDMTSATGSSLFSITAPSITMSVSSLGYESLARSAGGAIDFGTLLPGTPREIGTAGSGQTTAGAAVEVTTTSDTDTVLRVSSTNWSAGTETMAAGQLEAKRNGVAEAWTAMTTSAETIAGPTVPGTHTFSYDYRLTVPPAQPAGDYAATVTYTSTVVP